MAEIKFIGGHMHGRTEHLEPSQRIARPSLRGRPGPEYVQRMWPHPDGRMELVMVLASMPLGEFSAKGREVMTREAS